MVDNNLDCVLHNSLAYQLSTILSFEHSNPQEGLSHAKRAKTDATVQSSGSDSSSDNGSDHEVCTQ